MNAIVNVSENWGIGYRGDLLVHISEDLKRFRSLTQGKTVVYGRKTLDTFPGGKPLKNRENWLLSATAAPREDVRVFSSLEDLTRHLTQMGGTEDVWLAGGGSVYRQLLDRCDRVYLTRTLGDYPADAWFPNLDELPEWKIIDRSGLLTAEQDPQVRFEYLTYARQPKPGILFDLDGTLWDATKQLFPTWQRVLADYGKQLDYETVMSYMGGTVEQLAARALPDLPREVGIAAVDRCCREELDDLRKTPGILYPGVREVLEELRKRYTLAIVSNSQDGYVQTFLDVHGLWDLFDDIEMYGRTGRSKGENLQSVVQRNHLTWAVYVGDTAGDQEAAQAAGLPFLWARYGFGRGLDAKISIERFPELLNIVV